MADLFQWWQQDLALLPDGDILICSGATKTGEIMPGCATDEGEQRVLRRLLTGPGQYIWHPEYGAGLPGFVGQPVQIQALQAIILSQILLEDVVSKDPLPQVVATPILNGVNVNISYLDNNVGKQVTVGFDLNA